jgi:xanthine/CO dehydrogenase XdhC/CoxF family maturation factor
MHSISLWWMQALRNPAVACTGLIGSATKRARFEKRLRDAACGQGA